MKKEPKVEVSKVAIIRDGKESPFWREIKAILDSERSEINAQILQKEDLGLDDKAVSDLIKWHGFLGYVLNLPDLCIKAFDEVPPNDGTDSLQDPNDPYPLEAVRKKMTEHG